MTDGYNLTNTVIKAEYIILNLKDIRTSLIVAPIGIEIFKNILFFHFGGCQKYFDCCTSIFQWKKATFIAFQL